MLFKVHFFLLTYVVYFLLLAIILALTAWLNFFQKQREMIQTSSNAYVTSLVGNDSDHTARARIISTDEISSSYGRKISQNLSKTEARTHALRKATNIDGTDNASVAADNFSVTDTATTIATPSSSVSYMPTLVAYASSGLCYLGCEPVLYPDGFSCFRCSPFAKGQFEDFLVYLFNNHDLLRCFFSVESTVVRRRHWQYVYLLGMSISFFLVAFSGSVILQLVTDDTNSYLAIILFNLVVINALVSIINTAASECIRFIFTSFEVQSLATQSFVFKVLILWGAKASIFFFCLTLLVSAAIFTESASYYGIVFSFFFTVQVLRFFTQLLRCCLMFIATFHLRVSVFDFGVFTCGAYYHEKILHHWREEAANHTHYRHTSPGGVLSLDYIVSAAFAERRGWTGGDAMVAYEGSPLASGTDDISSFFLDALEKRNKKTIQENPIFTARDNSNQGSSSTSSSDKRRRKSSTRNGNTEESIEMTVRRNSQKSRESQEAHSNQGSSSTSSSGKRRRKSSTINGSTEKSMEMTVRRNSQKSRESQEAHGLQHKRSGIDLESRPSSSFVRPPTLKDMHFVFNSDDRESVTFVTVENPYGRRSTTLGYEDNFNSRSSTLEASANPAMIPSMLSGRQSVAVRYDDAYRSSRSSTLETSANPAIVERGRQSVAVWYDDAYAAHRGSEIIDLEENQSRPLSKNLKPFGGPNITKP